MTIREAVQRLHAVSLDLYDAAEAGDVSKASRPYEETRAALGELLPPLVAEARRRGQSDALISSLTGVPVHALPPRVAEAGR